MSNEELENMRDDRGNPVIIINLYKDTIQQFVQELNNHYKQTNTLPTFLKFETAGAVTADGFMRSLIKRISCKENVQKMPEATYFVAPAEISECMRIASTITVLVTDPCIQEILNKFPKNFYLGCIGVTDSRTLRSIDSFQLQLFENQQNPFEPFGKYFKW